MCLYSSERVSTAACWMVWKRSSSLVSDKTDADTDFARPTCNARLLDVYEMGLEHAFWSLVPLRSDLDDSAVRKLRREVRQPIENSQSGEFSVGTHRVVLHEHRRLLAQLLVQLQIIAHEAQRLLDTPHGLEVCGPLERVAPHEQKLDEVSGDVSACDVESAGEVREGKAVVDGDDVCDAVTRVDDYTGLQTYSSQTMCSAFSLGSLQCLRSTRLERKASGPPG